MNRDEKMFRRMDVSGTLTDLGLTDGERFSAETLASSKVFGGNESHLWEIMEQIAGEEVGS